jgi:hypothetical protein
VGSPASNVWGEPKRFTGTLARARCSCLQTRDRERRATSGGHRAILERAAASVRPDCGLPASRHDQVAYLPVVSNAEIVTLRLESAFGRFLNLYARYGGHNYYGWDDYDDPRNFKGPTFWSEDDCVFRLALELEKEFPYQVHLELPFVRWSFADFDKALDKRESIDLVVSDLHDFVEDDTSQQRFTTRRHELFLEGKYLPAGCSRTWRFDHLRKIVDIGADAARLARHIERGHCLAAAVLVVDDDGLFDDNRPASWPEPVALLLASPKELARRGMVTTAP